MSRVLVFASLIAFVLAQTVPFFPLQTATEYRTHNGTNNNLNNANQAAVGAAYLRVGGTFYADNATEPRCGGLGTSFTCRNEREIGLDFFNCTNIAGCEDPVATSDWAWATGLYLAIDLTRTVAAANPSEPFNIDVPAGDVHFPSLGFTRQQHKPDGSGPRIQTNAVSSYLDAHPIYGVNDNFNLAIRAGTGGLLAMQTGVDGLEYPIFVGAASPAIPSGVTWANLAKNVNDSALFRFGDARGNQNPVLMTVEILWMREHNRIARAISANNKNLDDNTVYQEARRRVIALMQHFYEAEYMPMLLGANAVPNYSGYNANTDASIDQFFGTVALRYGHIQVSSETLRQKEDGSNLASMFLKDNFFDPTIIVQDGIDVIMKGLNLKKHNTGEVTMIDDLRNHLYAKKGAVGLDLASLNMRRAREVGLPNYAAARAAYGLPVFTSFNATIPQDIADILIQVYGADDTSLCDPWLCGIVENAVNGGELGSLFSTVIIDQFNRLRAGDRFWYDNNQFSAQELNQIKKTTLADIIFRNSQIKSIACDIFEVPVAKTKFCKPPHGAASGLVASVAVIFFGIFALLF